MQCPYCGSDKDSLKVIDSRSCENDRAIRRRRECESCNKRFTTYERVDETVRLMVVKRDGRREPWDKTKVLRGVELACFKRAVPEEDRLRAVDEVEEEVFRTHDREVSRELVGKLVMDRLRRLDEVAYVRFASVYQKFKTLDELVEEAKAVIDAKRFEDDPLQGSLFIDPKSAADHDAGKAKVIDAKVGLKNGQLKKASAKPASARKKVSADDENQLSSPASAEKGKQP